MDMIYQAEDFLYTKSEDHAVVVGYVGNSEPVIVPETIGKLPVTKIGCREKGPWEKCVGKLVLSKNIQEIDPEALSFKTYLRWIYNIEVLPENVYFEVSEGVLYTKGKKKALFNVGGSEREEYIMPTVTEEVADDAFYGVRLKKLSISSGCKVIGARAFKYSNLETVEIPASVKEIGDEAFLWMGSTLVVEGDTILGNNVAHEIRISDGNVAYTITDNLLMNADKTRVLKYVGDGNDTSIKIPESVERIDAEAFDRATSVTKIALNKGLKYIGSRAFCNTKIKTAKLPASIEYFAPNAFSEQKPKVKISLAKDCDYYRSDDVAIYHKKADGSENIVKIIDKTIQKFIVPDTVCELSGKIFDGCTKLTSLILPEGLRIFDEYCLHQSRYDAENTVKQIALPASLVSLKIIGRLYEGSGQTKYSVSEENDHYFIDDDVLYEVNAEDDYTALIGQNQNIRRIELVEGTTAVANYAFSPVYAPKCTNLAEIILPSTIVVIGEHAFSGAAITNLVIPEGVKMISSDAFSNCSKLEKVSIPDSVEGIAYDAFAGCSKLKEISVSDSNSHYCSVDGVLYNKDCSKLIFFPEGIVKKELSVPEGVTDIGTVFSKCMNIEALKLPASLKVLNESAFSDCGIKEIFFASDLERIDDRAFGRRKEPIILHASQSSKISAYAKAKIQSGDKTVTVQSSKISAYAKAKIQSGDKTVTVIDDSEDPDIRKMRLQYEFDEVDDGYRMLLCKVTEKVIEIPGIIAGKTVVELSDHLFRPSYVDRMVTEEIIISEGVKRVGADLFMDLENLQKVVFPVSVEHIDEGIFNDLDLWNPVVTLVAEAGSYAEAFIKNHRPSNARIEVLNEDSNNVIERGTLEALEFEDLEDGSCSAIIKSSWEYEGTKKIIIPAEYNSKKVSLLEINKNFIGSFVKELYIGKNITRINYCKFNFAKGLSRLEVSPENICFSSDGIGLFSKDKSVLFRVFCFTMEEYRIPEGTTEIAAEAFGDCEKLKSIVIPNSVIKVGERAFDECKQLEKIDGIENIKTVGAGAFTGTLYSANLKVQIIGNTLVQYKETETMEYNVPEGIEIIGSNAFLYRMEERLESISLPSTLKKIEDSAFANRKHIKKLVVPEGTTEIGDRAFKGCESLEEIILPSSLVSIGTEAFSECYKLKRIEIPKGVSHIGDSAFPRHKPAKEKWLIGDAGDTSEVMDDFEGVTVSTENTNYSSENGVLFSADKRKIIFVPDNYPEKEFTVAEGVTEIGNYAFYMNRRVEKILFKGVISQFGKYAFSKMEALVKVEFTDAQKNIGESVFEDCSQLSEVVLPHGVESIEKRAFKGCGITRLSLPETVKNIGVEAFAENHLKSIVIPKSVNHVARGAFAGLDGEIVIYDNIGNSGEKFELNYFAHEEPTYIDSAIGMIGVPDFIIGSMGENCSSWRSYIIKILDANTGDEKLKVRMPGKERVFARGLPDRSYLQYAKLWTSDASFNYKPLDIEFDKLKVNKTQYCAERLRYQEGVDDALKDRFIKYLVRHAKVFVQDLILEGTVDELVYYEQFGIIKKANVDELIAFAKEKKSKNFLNHLVKYKSEKISKNLNP